VVQSKVLHIDQKASHEERIQHDSYIKVIKMAKLSNMEEVNP
jgi:hypothetical protein